MDNLGLPPSSETPPPQPEPEPDPSQSPTKKPKMPSTTITNNDEVPTAADLTVPRHPRYKLQKIVIFFAYYGVGYQGMLKNLGAKTIKGDFEEALYQADAVPEPDWGIPKRWDWARSTRTDKGVSAVGQVVSGKFYIDPPELVERLNENLSRQIRVFWYRRVTASFSAKKFCDRRRYVYLVPIFALDERCLRDRESVFASRKEGDGELAKCVECSERGRKVIGLMGKRSYQLRRDSEFGEDGSAISSSTRSAADGEEDNEGKIHMEYGNTDVGEEFRNDDYRKIKSEEKALEIVVDEVREGNSTAKAEREFQLDGRSNSGPVVFQDEIDNSNCVETADCMVNVSCEKVNTGGDLSAKTGTLNETEGIVEGSGANTEENDAKGSGICYGETEKERLKIVWSEDLPQAEGPLDTQQDS